MSMRRPSTTSSSVPSWLDTLLSARFFGACTIHPQRDRNMFCFDCADDAFCLCCRSELHSDHRVIQIRRSSYHDVVRAAEIQKMLDIGGVQTYLINSARVLFLNERRQLRGGGGGGALSAHSCVTCGRSLLDPLRFCSLGCKLVAVKRDGGASFVVGGEAVESGGGAAVVAVKSRRRKGIPRRAPFFAFAS